MDIHTPTRKLTTALLRIDAATISGLYAFATIFVAGAFTVYR